jgi:hypothetical protein
MKSLKLFIILTFCFTLNSCGQNKINTPKNAMIELENFRNKEKFLPDNLVHYPGIGDEKLKPILTEKINLASIDFEKIATKEIVNESEYHNAIKKGLSRFSDIYLEIDTENRERICLYFEELMDIVGLESSNGQLNDFMYNFNPTN